MLGAKLSPKAEGAYSLIVTLFIYVIALKFVAKQPLDLMTAWAAVITTVTMHFAGRYFLHKADGLSMPIERRALIFTALFVTTSLTVFSVIGFFTGSRFAATCGAFLFVVLCGVFVGRRNSKLEFQLLNFPVRKWVFFEVAATYLIAITLQALLNMAAGGFF